MEYSNELEKDFRKSRPVKGVISKRQLIRLIWIYTLEDLIESDIFYHDNDTLRKLLKIKWEENYFPKWLECVTDYDRHHHDYIHNFNFCLPEQTINDKAPDFAICTIREKKPLTKLVPKPYYKQEAFRMIEKFISEDLKHHADTGSTIIFNNVDRCNLRLGGYADGSNRTTRILDGSFCFGMDSEFALEEITGLHSRWRKWVKDNGRSFYDALHELYKYMGRSPFFNYNSIKNQSMRTAIFQTLNPDYHLRGNEDPINGKHILSLNYVYSPAEEPYDTDFIDKVQKCFAPASISVLSIHNPVMDMGNNKK